MKRTDMLGQALPILEVKGFQAFPPPFFLLKRHLPELRRYVQALLTQDFDAVQPQKVAESVEALFGRRIDRVSASDFLEIVGEYLDFVYRTLPSLPYCAVPQISDNGEDDGEIGYDRLTSEEKLVADYANMRITDVNRLNYVDFLILRREAFIYKLSLTKKGRELLLGAYCAEQTEPDRASLRAYFGGEKRGKE